ncbi:hypothetical protein ARMGADRAFT_1040113 [Armillaria gallica]|uniref:Uncharacterized protein n=1 Tax=Armillaria gallica TaxID=47427 RepID=A0A2H3CMF5_ARMGA|nr:hypothetical protein ARMGADRAFT_1040113 [Armillaria gallica]
MILPPKFSAFVLNPLLLLIATYSLVNATMQKSELLSKYWQSVTTTICKGLQDNIKLSVTMVSEDNDKAWFSPTLPPFSPHILEGPDDRKMVIMSANYAGKAGRAAQKFQCENGLGHHDAGMVDPEPLSVPKYSYNAFVDTIVEWIIADDQRVVEMWQKHIETLKAEMEFSQGCISVTMDLLTDLNLVNFIAVTAHWVEAVGTNADGLMIFLGITMTGWELQLSWVMMDNAANNGTFMIHLEHSRGYDIAFQSSIQAQSTYKMSGQMFCTHYFSPENLDIERDPIATTRALIQAGIEKFLDKQDFIEFRQYQLSDDEWQALYIIHQILAVCSYFLKSVLSTWADDLLGDNLFDMTLHPQGLETEVNAYLTDVKSSNDMVKYWQMLKFFLKQGQFLNFTTGMSKEDEVAVLEAMLTAEDSIPKDVEAY